MTTPEKPARAAAAKTTRKRETKPEAGRKGPDRSRTASAAPKAKAAPAPDPPPGPAAAKPPVSEAIAQAVRRAYDVIGENMAQGQAAAEHFRAGEYNIRDVPGDLNVLAKRLIALTRDVSLAACDVLEQLTNDPRLAGVPKGGPEAPGGFRPPPSPTDPTLGAAPPQSGAATGDAAPPAAPPAEPDPPPPARPSGPPPGAVKLQVVFVGKPAVLRASTFAPPDPPSPVFCPGLLGPPGAPAIHGVSFGAGDTPLAMKVTVEVPAQQPAGVYSGAICAKDTQAALGALTIEVVT